MRKQYDDFIQLKIKDMGNAISDMTRQYINPNTNEPTVVPAKHYVGMLDRTTESFIDTVTQSQYLVVLYNQLNSLKKDNEKYFLQALMCIDLGLNPKDLRVDEQIALTYSYDAIDSLKSEMKKDFRMLNDNILNAYAEAKNNPQIQRQAIQQSNMNYERENNYRKNNGYER